MDGHERQPIPPLHPVPREIYAERRLRHRRQPDLSSGRPWVGCSYNSQQPTIGVPLASPVAPPRPGGRPPTSRPHGHRGTGSPAPGPRSGRTSPDCAAAHGRRVSRWPGAAPRTGGAGRESLTRSSAPSRCPSCAPQSPGRPPLGCAGWTWRLLRLAGLRAASSPRNLANELKWRATAPSNGAEAMNLRTRWKPSRRLIRSKFRALSDDRCYERLRTRL